MIRRMFNFYAARLALEIRGEYYGGWGYVVIRDLRFVSNRKD